MIGDAVPHEKDSYRNAPKIDWREEADTLAKGGFNFYAVQAMNNSQARSQFWEPLASRTGGIRVDLSQFSDVVDYLLAICQHANGGVELVRTYRDEVKAAGRMNRAKHMMFSKLCKEETEFDGTCSIEGLIPVPPSRFQAMVVGSEKIPIKVFAQQEGFEFKAGRGFYEITKPENVSAKKEVVLEDIKTGDMFTGPEACAYLGENYGGAAKCRPPKDGSYRVYVQSTSYNRALVPHSRFLYELSSEADM